MYGDLLLDKLGVNFFGPAPLDLELLHMLTTFHWNALGRTLGWWLCHNNRVSWNENFWVEQVTVPEPPLGKDKAIKQRIQSSHMPPCHRHMVIATNFSSLFDLLLCSTPQTRAECCLELTAVSGY